MRISSDFVVIALYFAEVAFELVGFACYLVGGAEDLVEEAIDVIAVPL